MVKIFRLKFKPIERYYACDCTKVPTAEFMKDGIKWWKL